MGKIDLPLDCVALGTLNTQTDARDYYTVTLTSGVAYTVRLDRWTPGAADINLYLRDSRAPGYAIVGRSETGNSFESITYTPDWTGVYYVVPTIFSGSGTTYYHIQITR